MYMLPTKDTLYKQRYTQTENVIDKGIPWKEKQKESWGSNTYIRQNGFKTKTDKRQKRILHDDKRINQTRKYNNFKYTCNQHRDT